MRKELYLLLLLAHTGVLCQPAYQDIAEGIIVKQNLFSSTEGEVSCYRIPALITAPNGDLVAAIDERVPSCGDLKWSRDINIVIRRSTDNGSTWTGIERVVDFPDGKSASDPSMIADLFTGDIFLFYNYMDHDLEKDVYYQHVIRSSDNGKSWSEPVDITSQLSKPGWHADFRFITSGRGIQTDDGTLVHCLVNLVNGMHLFESTDHGASWHLLDATIAPADESKIVELADGSWMVNSRVNGSGLRYIHHSTDRGKSWTTRPDSTLIDPGCNASILRYSGGMEGWNNVLLFSNAAMKQGRENMTVRLSYDDGITWSPGKIIYPGGSAYSSMTILGNGDVGLFFEKDNYTENTFVSFSIEWLTEEE